MTKNVAGSGNYKTQQLLEEVAELTAANDRLMESYSAMARATLEFDEVGWSPVNQLNETGIKLEDVKTIARSARLQTQKNALLKRGSQLRASYVFGRGFKMSGNGSPLAPRFTNIIEDPINQAVLFGEEACKKNERTLFTDGNLFVAYDKSERQFFRVALNEVAGFAVSATNSEIITYVLREYTKPIDTANTRTEIVKVWYPTDYANQDSLARTIEGVRVDRNIVLFHRKENDESGSLWGVADCLPAMPWAWAYSEYLKDGSKMLKALSAIAWQIRTKTKAGVNNAALKVANNRQVAATVTSGSDVELAAMPRNNAVDLGTGEPLAAMAATAMEVSTDALLAGTGLSGGGGSQVLDQSTLNAAYARQGNWENFFVRILRFLGVQNPSVKFNAIIVDPSYRNIQSLATAWQSGLFSPEIMQAAMAEQVGIEAPGSVPDNILIPNTEPAVESDAATNVATAQGNSGPEVGDFTDGNNDLRDLADNPR
jgi:hypothetical protein